MERPTAAGRWLERNAKWFVPLAVIVCLGVCAAGVVGFLRWFDGYTRDLPPYRMALQKLRSHREAAPFLGPPIEARGQVQGEIKVNAAKSSANLAIPVQGSRHEGKLIVVATALGEDWTLHEVRLQVSKPERNFVIVREE